ncbi:MAG: Beta-ketoacyl synthase, partial [Myxococcaceae bacterium]|nr:Beta-ketoacyl synthase [Myxococcaceae bacterium]
MLCRAPLSAPGPTVTTPQRVAVTGMGAVTALGRGVTALAAGLRGGNSGVCASRPDDSAQKVWAPLPELNFLQAIAQLELDTVVQKRLHALGHRATPGLRSALLAAAEAWKQADCEGRDGSEIGLIVAGNNLGNDQVLECSEQRRAGRQVRPGYAVQCWDTDHVGAISEALSIKGEGYTVGGASASSGIALAQARRAILCGDVKTVLIVGPPTMLSSLELIGLSSIGALSREDPASAPARVCRPFDVRAAGFVYGQAAAAM